MKELDEFARFRIYIKALREVENKKHVSMCFEMSLEFYKLKINGIFSIKDFPELYSQKPTELKGSWFWWPRDEYGQKMRIQALENAIQEVKAKIKQQIDNGN